MVMGMWGPIDALHRIYVDWLPIPHITALYQPRDLLHVSQHSAKSLVAVDFSSHNVSSRIVFETAAADKTRVRIPARHSVHGCDDNDRLSSVEILRLATMAKNHTRIHGIFLSCGRRIGYALGG